MRIFTEPSFLIIQPLSGNALELNFVHQCLIMHRFSPAYEFLHT
jgi:hypothetical protein